MLTPAIADRVQETSATTGTGTLSLDGAVSRFRGFIAALGTGRVVEYVIVHRSLNEWEVGVGTITSGTPNTLSRDRIKSSSNAGALVSFSSGTKDVFIAPHANRPTGVVTAFLAANL